MKIERDFYLNQLISKKENGLIKIITGIRRSGKSFLLFNLFYDYLISVGVKESEIISITLDDRLNIRYRNPFELDSFVRERTTDSDKQYYVLIDEIQFVQTVENPYLKGDFIGFVDVLLGLMKKSNLDIYVTGSNSRLLSKDIVTQFRDRGDEIKLYPLSFREYCSAFNGSTHEAWREYCVYGGLPRILSLSNRAEKGNYLKNLFEKTYITDVIERNDIRQEKEVIDELLNEVASSVGSLTNPSKLANTFRSVKKINIHSGTIAMYLDYFVDAFVLENAYRFDVKGKKYINTPLKYYFSDIGLRNARLNFRQYEENHIMENILYNDLIQRGYNVDVGVVECRMHDSEGSYIRKNYEIDFVVNLFDETMYIQTALNVDSKEKMEQETMSLRKVRDSFKKIVVIKDDIIPWYDENGILFIGIEEFLLKENLKEL